jgi:hypothetical protein
MPRMLVVILNGIVAGITVVLLSSFVGDVDETMNANHSLEAQVEELDRLFAPEARLPCNLKDDTGSEMD